MTKMRKAVVFMTVLGLTSMLFAEAPKSMKKIATNDLIEDELVDNFDVGIDGAKGLWFAGYNGEFKNFNFGYGLYFGNIWFSVYDELATSTFDTFKKATRDTDAVAKDGMNVDYTNSKYAYSKGEVSDRDIKNDLYLAMSINKIGAQLYWKLTDTTPTNTKNAEVTTINPAAGTETTLKDKGFRYRAVNDIGAYVNGIRTKDIGKVKFYVELTEVGAEWKRDIDKTKNDNSEENGTKITKETTTTRYFAGTSPNPDSYTYLKPYAGMELGLALPSIGNSTNQFTFNEKFSYTIPFDTVKTKKEVVDESNPAQKVTTITEEKTNYSIAGAWENVMTPKVTSTYAIGENLTVKTAFDADITLSFNKTGKDAYKTSKVETITYNNATDTETKTVTESKSIANASGVSNGYVTKTLETKVEPRTSIGMTYAVKPGKFDVYVGGLWNAGTFTFKNENKRMLKAEETTKTTTTDQFGKEVVTVDTKTVSYPDTPADDTTDAQEYKAFDFIGTNPAEDKIWIGSTMYFTENMKMDVSFTTGFNTLSITGATGLLSTSLGVSFAIKF